MAHAFANPPTEPDFVAPEVPDTEVPEPSEEEPGAAVAGLAGQAAASGGFHFMQESELDNAGLGDSQEWVDVPENQVTNVVVTATTVEASHEDEITTDQTVPIVQQPEVIDTIPVFSSSS